MLWLIFILREKSIMKKYNYKWDYCEYCNRRTTSHISDGSCICKTCQKKHKSKILKRLHYENKKNKKYVPSNNKPLKDETILVFGDLHLPYHREGAIKFLEAVKKKYKPTKVICTGDEVDNHAIGFHDLDPDNLGANEELTEAIGYLKRLYKLFPNVDLVDSNHGSMVFRKAKVSGIPLKCLRSMKDILEAPEGWKWHKDYLYKMNNGQDLFVTHGLKKDTYRLAEQYGCCVAQGHYHEDSLIRYASNPRQLIWGCSVGCLVDDDSLAMEYNKTNMKRPILSCLIIINGIPQLVPMIIKDHKWVGYL